MKSEATLYVDSSSSHFPASCPLFSWCARRTITFLCCQERRRRRKLHLKSTLMVGVTDCVKLRSSIPRMCVVCVAMHVYSHLYHMANCAEHVGLVYLFLFATFIHFLPLCIPHSLRCFSLSFSSLDYSPPLPSSPPFPPPPPSPPCPLTICQTCRQPTECRRRQSRGPKCP